VHFTPAHASWFNQVEIWFNRITQQAIRRGTLRSVKELVAKIDQYVQTSNHYWQPFVRTPLRIRSSLKFNDYVNVFPGRCTKGFSVCFSELAFLPRSGLGAIPKEHLQNMMMLKMSPNLFAASRNFSPQLPSLSRSK
jgi:hypothetical protein